MTILVAILVFGIIVLVHEFGHYIIAKKNGIKVEEFAIGMGPKLVSKQVGETVYSVRILPIGGFCKMLGEEEQLEDERSFSSKSVSARMAVIAAGPFMNFLLAFIIIAVIVGTNGFTSTTVNTVEPGYPAKEAGLQSGDKIIKMNNDRIRIMDEITYYLYKNEDRPMILTVQRNNQQISMKMTPKWDEQNQTWRLGFSPSFIEDSFFGTMNYSFHKMLFLIKMTVVGFVEMITGHVSRDEVAGPIGIVQMIGQTYEVGLKESIIAAIANVSLLGAILSANLGALNLFPIPALDGSRLVFLAIEGIRRKPLDPNKENMIHLVGFALLMVFMVYIAYNDISRIIQ